MVTLFSQVSEPTHMGCKNTIEQVMRFCTGTYVSFPQHTKIIYLQQPIINAVTDVQKNVESKRI